MTELERNIILINGLLDRMEKVGLSKEDYKILQKLLLRSELLYRDDRDKKNPTNLPYPLCKTTITGDKIMFISDTHHGNKQFENRKLTDHAYNTAIKQNIKTVVHAGDLTESTTAPQRWDIPYNTAHPMVKRELETAIKAIPDELQIKLLLGNHDYTTIKKFPTLIPYFTDNQKIDVLGMQRVLLNWDDYATIYLDHFTSQLKYPERSILKDEMEKASIVLEGHHHYYNVREEHNAIELPSLSKDTFRVHSSYLSNRGYKGYAPIFVIASKQGEHTILFEAYCTDCTKQENLKRGDLVEVDTKAKQLKLYK